MNTLKRQLMDFIKTISDEELKENIKLRKKVEKLKKTVTDLRPLHYRDHDSMILKYINKDHFFNN